MKAEHRSVWKKLVYALAATPMVAIIGLLIITVIGAVDDAITRWQHSGHWWIILILGFIASLIYFFCEPKFRRDQKTKKYASALILFWEWRLANEKKPEPSDSEIGWMRIKFVEKIRTWASLMGESFSENFQERFTGCPFELVDVVLAERQKWEEKFKEAAARSAARINK